MQRNTWLDSWHRIPCREGRKAVPENSPVSHLSPSPITWGCLHVLYSFNLRRIRDLHSQLVEYEPKEHFRRNEHRIMSERCLYDSSNFSKFWTISPKLVPNLSSRPSWRLRMTENEAWYHFQIKNQTFLPKIEIETSQSTDISSSIQKEKN